MLIYVQHYAASQQGRVPELTPTYVAGFKQWLSLNRHVMKGQGGYAILAPVTARFASSTPEECRVLASPRAWREAAVGRGRPATPRRAQARARLGQLADRGRPHPRDTTTVIAEGAGARRPVGRAGRPPHTRGLSADGHGRSRPGEDKDAAKKTARDAGPGISAATVDAQVRQARFEPTRDTNYPGDKGSSRVKDLVDLVVLAHTQIVDLDELRAAIAAKRVISGIEPFGHFDIPTDWTRTYPKTAKGCPGSRVLHGRDRGLPRGMLR
jgi:hypothetical protein